MTLLPRCSEKTTGSNVLNIGGNMHRDCVYCMKLIIIEFMGKNLKMCTNAYFFEKKSELSELH